VSIRDVTVLILMCLAMYLAGLGAIPPLDRDEARFAQASKQMLETGDYVDIRFQDVPRYKKPVGTYWAQAATTGLLSSDRNAIWTYRVPSVVGATAAVLLTLALARLFLPRRTALLAAGVLATSLLLGAEAHMAKTDALLLATVVAVQLGLARAWLGRDGPATWLVFWLGIGAGVLLKGPVTPMVAVLTLAALCWTRRSVRWAALLRPLPGLVTALALALPWFVAVHLHTGGAFLSTAFGTDLLPRLRGGMESHGAPPGYYLVLLAFIFWPGSLLLWPGLVHAWRHRADSAVCFLLCWILPTWLVMEVVPTKLPHYLLPVLPALAIVSVYWIDADASGGPVRRLNAWSWMAVSVVLGCAVLALVVAGIAGPAHLTGEGLRHAWAAAPLAVLAAGVPTVAGAAAGLALLARRPQAATLRALAGGGLFVIALSQLVLPSLTQFQVSSRVVAQIRAFSSDTWPTVLAVGYHEPSLVFLAGTATRLVTAEQAALVLLRLPDAVAVIERRQRAEFRAAAAGLGLSVQDRATVSGINYSKGREVTLEILTRKGDG